MKSVTMRDVAQEAEVAQSTVSHFLNGTAPVAIETQKKIIQAIRKLNYYPNVTARNFKQRKTNIIGLLIPDITNMFYAELAKGVIETAKEKNYNLLLYATDYQRRLEKDYIELIVSKQVDGVVVGYNLIDEKLWDKLKEARVPVSTIDVSPVNDFWPSVFLNNEEGIQQGLSYLVKIGHRQIAYLSEPPYALALVERQRAFLRLVRSLKLDFRENWILVEKKQRKRVEIGFSLGEKLMSERPLPTAVMCSSDLVAVGAMKAFLSAGLKVPEDISIIGFDDILLCSYVHPSLTSIKQPKYDMGKIGIELLEEVIANREPREKEKRIVVNPSLVKRQSCRALND